ncbi:hypothetical protein LBMAG53_27020 [Planctomycetota bacterium]|nr:hypothetical protein LBMAG53_27020 [Planctomycetota bacterium]
MTSHYHLSLFATATVAGLFLVGNAGLGAAEAEAKASIQSTFESTYIYRTFLKEDAVRAEERDGLIILTGQVAEPSHKYLAQEAVAGLSGVSSVDNRLQVKSEGTEKSDSWIQSKVRSVLALHRNVSDGKAQVDIKDGVITLRGEATTWTQRIFAAEYAEDVEGVIRVINLMTVQPLPVREDRGGHVGRSADDLIDDASVAALVRSVLANHRSTMQINVKVAARDGVVTLIGSARNPTEKYLVTILVSDIQGVTAVKNVMTVEAIAAE